MSMTSLFVSWGRVLARQLVDEYVSPAHRVAGLMQFAYGLIGDDLQVETDGRGARLHHQSTRMSVPEYAGWELPPVRVLETMADAWSVVARTIGPPVHVRVTRPQGAVAEWTISTAGGGVT